MRMCDACNLVTTELVRCGNISWADYELCTDCFSEMRTLLSDWKNNHKKLNEVKAVLQ